MSLPIHWVRNTILIIDLCTVYIQLLIYIRSGSADKHVLNMSLYVFILFKMALHV